MSWRNISEISEGVYWVGVRDWNRRIFDALIPLPKGTSYNSYLVIGDSKRALIDTVNPGFEEKLEEKIRKVTDPSELDYVIMNHAEPDHADAIPHIMALNSRAKLVTTSRGGRMAKLYFEVSEERIIVVKNQEIIDLGGKTLRFIEAPMLHWPETMFTYLQEDKILFPCDFFGSHLAKGLYDDEVEDLLVHAKRYWGEIMMPFRTMAQKALEKIGDLEIRIIAPSHGPIHRNPERILSVYREWAYGKTRSKVIVAYVTMWKGTERMIQVLVDTLLSEGVEAVLHNLTSSDIGDLAGDLVDSRAIVLGAPTVLGGVHPVALYVSYLVKALRPPLKYAAVLSSYGWGGGAVKQIQKVLDSLKMEVVGALEINGPPKESDMEKVVELGKALAEKVKDDG